MGFEFAYQPAKLQELLHVIRKSYPSHEEFIRLDHSEQILYITEAVASLEEEGLLQFARKLKNSEMEYVLLALASCIDERICSKLAAILELRFRKALYELNWIMVQRDFTNKNLLTSMRKLAHCLEMKFPAEYADSIFARLDAWGTQAPQGTWGERGERGKFGDGLAESMHNVLVSESMDIHGFCKKVDLKTDSPLANRLSELFFLQCSHDGFRRNKDVFTSLMRELDDSRAAQVFARYLENLDTLEYFDELNYYIEEKYGAPGKLGIPGEDGAVEEPKSDVEPGAPGEEGFWKLLPESCTYKFFRWQDLKRIEAHFGMESKGYKLWRTYFDKMKQIVRYEEDGLLFMDFGTFVAVDSVDPIEEESASYLYDHKYFDNERELYEWAKGDESAEYHWRIIPEHVMDAKDLIVEDMTAEVYRVGYDQVQLLYLKEIIKVFLEKSSR